jgi:cytochrome P450
VFLTDPDLVRQVFTGDPAVFHAGEGNAVLLPVVGKHSVLLLDDRAHMTQRKLLLPPFHGERMQRYGELMTEIARREIDSWSSGSPLRLLPRMQGVTLEVILRAVFGMQEGDRLDRMRAALVHLTDMSTAPKTMALLALIGPRRASRASVVRREIDPVDELIFDEIRRRQADPDVAEREDILSLLVQATHEDGSPMSDAELRDELITLLVAGHETTATALSWTVERLARHPEVLARLREEIDAGEETYLDAVIKESLRLRPVLPVVVRRLTEPVEIGGYRLPKGASVTPCIYLLHRREDVYPESRRFRPERFLERPAGTYTWIPFGGGVRRCLGASFAVFEMKQVLSELIGRLELSAVDPAPERVRRRAITLTPGRGAEVLVSERERAEIAA